MSRSEGQMTSVPAVLPSGAEVDVRVTEDSADGIGSVGLVDAAALQDVLATIGEVAGLLREKLEPVKPTTATVQFGVSFEAKGGRLAALLFDATGAASL